MYSRLYQQMNMDRHCCSGKFFKGDSIRAGSEYFAFAQPPGSINLRTRAACFRNELPGVLEILPPSRAQKDHVAAMNLDSLQAHSLIQMRGCDGEIFGQRVHLLLAGDVEQHTSPQDRFHCMDGMLQHSTSVGLYVLHRNI